MAGEMSLTRPGQIDGAGATDALFLKQYSGEILTAFNEKNVMMGLHLIRQISKGKVTQFPATWKTGAAYHTPGDRVAGAQSVKHNERLIYIDDVLLSDIFVAQLDELRQEDDYRAIYSEQQGAALAKAFDQKTQQVAILASRAAATVTGGFGGTEITSANARTTAADLVSAFGAAAQAMDEKDIPEDDRYSTLKPAQYYTLLGSDKVVSRDYDVGGSIRNGKISMLYDIDLIKSNNVPQTDLSGTSESAENNTYYADFSNVIAPVFHKSAIGSVKRLDLTVQKTADDGDFAVEYQGILLVAKYNMGHGILRPEAAAEINDVAV
jgi:hypothetical protein